MKVWTCNTFKGHWPVGTAAVVVAPDEATARVVLADELREIDLELAPDDELVLLDTSKLGAVVLRDGDY